VELTRIAATRFCIEVISYLCLCVRSLRVYRHDNLSQASVDRECPTCLQRHISDILKYFLGYQSLNITLTLTLNLNHNPNPISTVLCQKGLSDIFCHFLLFRDYDTGANNTSPVKFLEDNCAWK